MLVIVDVLGTQTLVPRVFTPSCHVYWVAVKELTLSYHIGYIVNNRVSPI